MSVVFAGAGIKDKEAGGRRVVIEMQGARMVVKVISCSILLLLLCSDFAEAGQRRVSRYFKWGI